MQSRSCFAQNKTVLARSYWLKFLLAVAKTRSASFAVASGAAPCTRTFRPPMQRRPRPPARARRQTALTSGQRHYPRARRRRRRRLRPAPRWQCRRTSRGSSPGRSGKAALQSSGPPPAARPTTTSHPRCPRVLRPARCGPLASAKRGRLLVRSSGAAFARRLDHAERWSRAARSSPSPTTATFGARAQTPCQPTAPHTPLSRLPV